MDLNAPLGWVNRAVCFAQQPAVIGRDDDSESLAGGSALNNVCKAFGDAQEAAANFDLRSLPSLVQPHTQDTEPGWTGVPNRVL